MRLSLFLFALAASLAAAPREIEFNRDVRPVLSDKCYFCHGPDAAAKKIPLRLDVEQQARRVVDSGALVKRITAEKDAMRMPPVHSGLKLTAAEIETLKTWVTQGAKWQQHWSFIAPKRPTLPEGTAKHPIDRFIEARLRREGLSPSPAANPETLLRRVSLDLTGVPTSPAEMDAFLKDRNYEAAVDRLLRSPRYGERMAARWLDAARYADSNGYQYDGERVMWRWRDWVIDAFNHNKPFDQFTLEQIAGDMLPNATLEQKIATGFNRNHRANTEDGIIPEEYAVEYVVDRVETTSTVFLGLTLGCARCHNHKYDPLKQKEFYQVFAYFNNIPELGRAMKYGNSPPLIPAPTVEQKKQLDSLDAKIRLAESKGKALDQGLSSWTPPADFRWSPTTALDYANDAGFDGKVVDAPGKAAFDIEDRFTLAAWADGADGSILTRMTNTARGKGFGIYIAKGKLHVHMTSAYNDDAIRMDAEQPLAPGRHHIAMTYSGSRMAEGIKVYVDGQPTAMKVQIDTLYRPFNNALKVFPEPLRIGGGGGGVFHGKISGVRVYSRVLQPEEVAAMAVPDNLATIARKPARTPAEANALRWAYLDTHEQWRALSAMKLEREMLERTFPTVMIMSESPRRKDTFLLLRGAYDKPGEKVEPGVPAILPPLPAGAPNNRLGFAEWLISRDNPLLARVTVNRFWQMYFGTGIVKTTEDFGSQGEWPVHPELLDWLAVEFMESGWNVKALQRLIVTSNAYRQSSKASPELLQKDPDNRLLARGPRFRMSPEMIRDSALAEGGLLVDKVGGPSVKPYQPAGLWKELTMQTMEYEQGRGEDLYRRGLYTFWKRTVAPPMMVNFDSANREACVVRENRTNTPLQALNLMNDTTFLEAARFIGQRMIKEGGADRLGYGFRIVTGRTPNAKEREVLRGSLQFHLDYFAGKDGEAKAFLKQGATSADASIAPRELAAYASVASLLLNLDEAVTKE